jgi:hypothetical protein
MADSKIAKFIVAGITGSSAMLSEGIRSGTARSCTSGASSSRC